MAKPSLAQRSLAWKKSLRQWRRAAAFPAGRSEALRHTSRIPGFWLFWQNTAASHLAHFLPFAAPPAIWALPCAARRFMRRYKTLQTKNPGNEADFPGITWTWFVVWGNVAY